MILLEDGKILKDYFFLRNSKIIFYGASTRNRSIIDELDLHTSVLFYIDNDTGKHGTQMDGYDIYPISKLECVSDAIVLSVLVEYACDVEDAVKKYDCRCLFCMLKEIDIAVACTNNWAILNSNKRYKYIHFFNDDKFIVPFYTMIKEQFEIKEHLFIVDYARPQYDYGVDKLVVENNVLYGNLMAMTNRYCVQEGYLDETVNCNAIYKTDKMRSLFCEADKIILHSMFFSDMCKKYMSEMTRYVGDKMAWIAFGGDTYWNREHPAVENIIQRIKYSYLLVADIERVKENYSINPTQANMTYSYISYNIDCKSDIRADAEVHNRKFRILLGHSAANYSNHVYGLEMLYKYKDDNIEIICPLSYGEQLYRQNVIEKGQELFGDKFIPMVDFMELEEYYNFLNSIDVAVLPMTRVAAGTTVRYLNAMSVPMFFTEVVREAYLSMGISSSLIDEIGSMSFEEFYSIVKDLRNCGTRSADVCNAQVVKAWQEIFAHR